MSLFVNYSHIHQFTHLKHLAASLCTQGQKCTTLKYLLFVYSIVTLLLSEPLSTVSKLRREITVSRINIGCKEVRTVIRNKRRGQGRPHTRKARRVVPFVDTLKKMQL